MKCEEFRKQIIADDSDMKFLEQHLENCPACSAWIEKELSTAPKGMSQSEWLSATSRCMPESLPITNQKEETQTDPEPISTGFFTGLKYGLVFGLSIITGLAIVHLAQFTPKTVGEVEKIEIASFIEEAPKNMPSFIESDFSDVTFFDYHDSKLMTFVENEKITSFIEEYQEEEQWIEKDSG